MKTTIMPKLTTITLPDRLIRPAKSPSTLKAVRSEMSQSDRLATYCLNSSGDRLSRMEATVFAEPVRATAPVKNERPTQ